MSDKSGGGSVIFKILILLFIAGLIAVILIPGRIWEREAYEKRTAQHNMTSIYEALNFYKRKTNTYTTNPQEILSVVRSDSSILLQQKVVNHTEQLTSLIDAYLNDTYVSSLMKIYQNINQIIEDLELNRRRFEAVDQYFLNESEAIIMDLKNYKGASQYETLSNASVFLDSLQQMRRDLSDYSLQVGASDAASLTDTLKSILPEINANNLQSSWNPIATRIETFASRAVRSEQLSKQTSVADRVQEFSDIINASFEDISTINIQDNIEKVNQISNGLDELYDTFLRDFIATSRKALYKLPLADSLIIHLTESKFYSPVNNEMYKIFIMDDSSAVKVESPVLVDELREKVVPIAENIESLPLLPAFSAYFDTLEVIKDKAQTVRRLIRRNTDIFIKYKEIEEVVIKFEDISVGTAFSSLDSFVLNIPGEQSFSDIKNQLEETLQGSRIFYQAYDKQNFGNLDSLQQDLIVLMEEFNALLDEVRRLPEGAEKFEAEFEDLEQLVAEIKGLNLLPQLDNIIKDLESALIFAAEGKEETVYLIFKKTIQNLGYVYKDQKSWEEEDN